MALRSEALTESTANQTPPDKPASVPAIHHWKILHSTMKELIILWNFLKYDIESKVFPYFFVNFQRWPG